MTEYTPQQVEEMFRDGILNEEFQVFYQPKVELKKYSVCGAEALCRWVHNGEFILPYQFIPVFEKDGNIRELDFYMLRHVCEDMVKWKEKGYDLVVVSVNLSRVHIGDEKLVEKITDIIDSTGLPRNYIEIEVTETTTEVEYAKLKKIVSDLHDRGIRTAIDDFGVGFSSMSILHDLPWDIIKIDRGFIPVGDGSKEDRDRLVLLKSLIMLSRSLGVECIAEGTETIDQIILLKENDCFMAQGFYFDKPLPRKEFEKRLITAVRAAVL